MLGKTIKERKQYLQSIFDELITDQVGIVKGNLLTSQEEVFEEFNKSIINNDEGIIIKDAGSVYFPGERNH